MRKDRAKLDAIILDILGKRPSTMTYVVRNVIAMDYGVNLDTPLILRRLKHMEKAGLVERVRSVYAVMLCWRKTDQVPA